MASLKVEQHLKSYKYYNGNKVAIFTYLFEEPILNDYLTLRPVYSSSRPLNIQNWSVYALKIEKIEKKKDFNCDVEVLNVA